LQLFCVWINFPKLRQKIVLFYFFQNFKKIRSIYCCGNRKKNHSYTPQSHPNRYTPLACVRICIFHQTRLQLFNHNTNLGQIVMNKIDPNSIPHSIIVHSCCFEYILHILNYNTIPMYINSKQQLYTNLSQMLIFLDIYHVGLYHSSIMSIIILYPHQFYYSTN
jgi:hypothetical protein